jgi:DNA (cytosine-5)-methyltransferase 1
MRYGSVCSGIEAATVAWRPLGWRCAFVSEVEPFASEVLKHRLPKVPNLGDFTKIKEGDYGNGIDLLVGGTPCQSFSSGGTKGGIADPRGNLALEFARLAERTRCRWVVWENVPAVLAIGGGRDFARILSEFVGWDVKVHDGGWRNAGIATNAPGRFGVSWRVLDARYTRVPPFPGAVPQRRRRVVLVGFRGDWTRAAEALLGGELCGGSAPPRRESRVRDAADAGARPEAECFPIDMMNLERSTTGIKAKCYDDAGSAMYTLRSSHVNAVCTPTQLRRLLPVESERLMGFPDGWTDISWKGKAHAPGGYRHRVCGNSMCVNVMRWVGERIDAVESGKEFEDYGTIRDGGNREEPPALSEEGGG